MKIRNWFTYFVSHEFEKCKQIAKCCCIFSYTRM